MTLAWGKRLSPEFRVQVGIIGANLGINPDYLMACMAFESGETFSPAILNKAGSGAVGLIQFMPQTAHLLGTSADALAHMDAVSQLHYVEKYFQWCRGRLHTLEDTYMAILWPAAIGKPNEYVLFDKADLAHPAQYIQNRGLDWNQDGKITKAEAAAGPRARLAKGLLPENVWNEPSPSAASSPPLA